MHILGGDLPALRTVLDRLGGDRRLVERSAGSRPRLYRLPLLAADGDRVGWSTAAAEAEMMLRAPEGVPADIAIVLRAASQLWP